jgi:aminoacyl tRNA synthase complex-interacting multifunctional protein 1
MENQMVVVLCNLKAKKLADYMSHGMVLCAEPSDRSQAELLKPPEGCQPGDIITFEGYERKPPEQLNPKKNPWDNVQPKLKVNDKGVACYENIPFMTEKGPVTSKSIINGEIH